MDNKILVIALLVASPFVMYQIKHRDDDNLIKPIAVAPPIVEVPKIEIKVDPAPLVIKTPTTYEEALAASKQLNKDLVVVVGADWCHYCVQLHNTTLKDESVKEALKGYVFYDLDSDKERNAARSLGVSGIPAYFVISKDTGKAIKSGTGYRNSQEFKNWLVEKFNCSLIRF